MKKIKLLAAAFAVFILCSCSEAEPAITETETPVTTVSEDNSYALVRPWTGGEMLDSIFYCGEKRPLPVAAAEEADPENLPAVVFFDNGSAAAKYDELGNIVGLKFERGTAPEDLSVYGIDFKSRPDDIPDKVGIADSIYGDVSGTITYTFRGGGITELTFVYTDRSLVSVYIEA
ncbi:MAG: hypothetical protein K2H90_09335 [Oscillospiraceae bacterium]|nr:hypothetical protein [Oscillospiraceae bacterium]